jgi:hypothetical protein|tara:strand:+ start:192 stop:461 length:270 start_codon:yes stop_codon:yes gene_type:complete
MSLEKDVSFSVKTLVDNIKATVQNNLNEAVQKGMITLEDNKVEGVNRLVQSSIDQAFVTGTELLTNTLSSYTREMNKASKAKAKTKAKK